MSGVVLRAADRAHFLTMMRRQLNSAVHRRMNVLLHLDDGCRITPVYLPSYAPNLNLIECVWLFMKRKVLFNEYDPTFADFRKAFDDFFAHIGGWKDEIERLLTPKFHYIGAPENGIPWERRYITGRRPS